MEPFGWQGSARKRGLNMASDLLLELECKTADEFLDAISMHGSYFGRFPSESRWLFRGQKCANLALRPSAFRNDQATQRILAAWEAHFDSHLVNSLPVITRFAIAESDLIRRFVYFADEQGIALPLPHSTVRETLLLYEPSVELLNDLVHNSSLAESHGRRIYVDLLPVLALMQHYGIPTRLLDWTLSAFAASYFAARECDISSAGALAVWALYEDALVTGPRQGPESPYFVVPIPPSTNPNMRAQRGVSIAWRFNGQISNLEDACMFTSFSPRPHSRYDHPVFYKFTLPHRHAEGLMTQLAKYGVSGTSMFPGFAGAAQSVLESCRRITPMQ